MRLLVADVGNTSTAVGLWSDGRVSHVEHVDGPADAALGAAKRLVDKWRPEGAAYVSVVPAKDRRFLALFRRLALPAAQVSHPDFPVAGLRL
ncbi:MAG: type III pantothenate kinase, partial [Kiritimatiellae bacterium]|nr:type III pantothenate kinase [Kiritimatiellia bacterium]